MNKNKIVTVFVALMLIAGVGLIAYPTVSDLINAHTQTRAIAGYTETVENMTPDNTAQMLADAQAYNAALAENEGRFNPTENDLEQYNGLLDVTGTGIMGYVEIPAIDVRLPIYHGTSDSALQQGIGHMVGSSLPVGGRNTHCVISGHSGLVSSRLLTDLEEVKEGDLFYLHTLDRTLAYQVDQIKTVLPEETDDLAITEGDFVTIVTCTPYVVNTHRLLVRGTRVPMPEQETDTAPVYTDTTTTPWPALLLAVVVLMNMVVLILNHYRKRGGHAKNHDSES